MSVPTPRSAEPHDHYGPCLIGVCLPVSVVRVRGLFGRTRRWVVAGYSNHRWYSASAPTRGEAMVAWRLMSRPTQSTTALIP